MNQRKCLFSLTPIFELMLRSFRQSEVIRGDLLRLFSLEKPSQNNDDTDLNEQS